MKDDYWQVPLTDSSSKLTTFHTHVGRYKFKRLPFGLSSANEVFQKRVTQVFGGLTGVSVIYDDILIYANTEKEHNDRLRKALQRAQQCGVNLNKMKCKFMLPEVTYIGRTMDMLYLHKV